MSILKIQGRYLSGDTSKHQSACLEVSTGHSILIVTTNPESRMVFDSADIKITSRLGNTPREIFIGDNQLFITDDNSSVDALAVTLNKKHYALLHKLESNLPVIIVALLVTILLVVSSTLYGIPKAAKFIAHEFPDFTTEKFSDGMAVLDRTLFEPSTLSEEKKQSIEGVFQPFLKDHDLFKPTIFFRSGVGPNAFALPNGEIVFTDELIALADNDDELIAILFHELGHLKHKHITRRGIQNVMITLMALFIIGDINSVDFVTALPAMLLDLSYSREFEREADQYAVEQLVASGIPVSSFVSIMQKIHNSVDDKEEDKTSLDIPQYLSTHPRMEERIIEMRKNEYNLFGPSNNP